MSRVPPKTFVEWERVLCHHFLTNSNGDTSPIRSLEVTPSTLAESFHGDPVTQADEAMDAFRASLNSEKVCAALEHGQYVKLLPEDLPSCFSYLALTLLVDSLIDEQIEVFGAFRSKLASFLRIQRSFSNLTGVAQMWCDLKLWLDDKIAQGESYRPLVLPDPGWWSHIGYTVRLSFPSRRDKRLMQHFLGEHPHLVANPNAFLTAFRNVAAGAQASWGLKEAFEEFHHDFLAGRRALGNHRFWVFVQAISHGRQSSTMPSEVSIEMTRDQDDAWIFALTLAGFERTHREYFVTLESVTNQARSLDPHDLTASVAKGIIVFRQTGHARWRAAGSLSECVGRVIAGVSSEVAARIGNKLGQLALSGSWFLTEQPVPIAVIEDALTRVAGVIGQLDRIVSVSVFDGVRSGAFWLGRRRFLPRIAADGSALEVRAEGGKKIDVSCVEVNNAPGVFRLETEETLDGRFLIATTAGRDGAPAWSRRLFFVADALVHEPGESAFAGVPLLEWEDLDHGLPAVATFDPAWDDSVSEVDDLIEAIYAGGKSGWNEMDLISLVQEAFVDQVSPWDMLRSLQESAFLKPMLRPQWKGRVWCLVPPSLVSLPHKGNGVVIAQGCLGTRLIDEFKRAVAGAGGTVFRRRGVSRFAPMLVGCVNADVDLLVRRICWPWTQPVVPGKRKLAFCLTSRRPERYIPASRWCWERRRFVPPHKAAGERVTLTRWTHPGARDHDVYVVVRGDDKWHFLSRTAAIALAHSLSATPLFRASNGMLHRVPPEGALPDALAAISRIRHLANPGPGGTLGSYTYQLTYPEVRDISAILPNIVDGVKDSTGTFNVEGVSSVVHSGGRIRVTWKGGGLSTTHSS